MLPWTTIYKKDESNYECHKCNPLAHYRIFRLQEEARGISNCAEIKSIIQMLAGEAFHIPPEVPRGPKSPIDLYNLNLEDGIQIRDFYRAVGNALDLIISKCDTTELDTLAGKVRHAKAHPNWPEKLRDALRQEVVRLMESKRLKDATELGILYDFIRFDEVDRDIVGSNFYS